MKESAIIFRIESLVLAILVNLSIQLLHNHRLLKYKRQCPRATLQQLGILEDDLLEDNQGFPEVRGKGKISNP